MNAFKQVFVLLVGVVTLGALSQAATKEPDHIQVQHILIGFKESMPAKHLTLDKSAAEKKAKEVMAEAKKDPKKFDELVKKYTNDQAPGIYGMSNVGVTPAQGEYPRQGMVPAFGNVGFKLAVGEIGLANFDPQTSPYGFHIIKRIK